MYLNKGQIFLNTSLIDSNNNVAVKFSCPGCPLLLCQALNLAKLNFNKNIIKMFEKQRWRLWTGCCVGGKRQEQGERVKDSEEGVEIREC